MNENIKGLSGLKQRLSEPVTLPRGSKYSNSRIWYATFIPLLSLFIEIYADCFALGVLVWCCCIIAQTAACLLDRRYLKQQGVDVAELHPAMAVLPPLYIFKRTAITKDQNTAAIIWICFAFYAACANSFSQGIMMDQDKMISQVRDNYWISLDNVKGYEYADEAGFVGTTINKAPESLGAKGKAKWTAKRMEDRIYVTVTRGELTLKFEVLYDGFTFTEAYLTEYSDGTVSAKYEKDGDNTVFKQYVETLLKPKSKSKKSDSSEKDGSKAPADSKSEESAEKKAAA